MCERQEDRTKEAVNTALRMLARMDRTEAELKLRLLKKNFTEEEAQAAAESMKAYGYLNDRRYAESYIRVHRDEKSRMQMTCKLLEKGIDRETVNAAMREEGPEEEIRLIISLIGKRIPDPSVADRETLEKTKAWLYRRGFRAEDIRKAVDDILASSP